MQIEEVRAPSSEFRFCILHSDFCIRIAPVAQLPERDASNVGDAGESPAGSTNFICDFGFTIYDCPRYAADRHVAARRAESRSETSFVRVIKQPR